MKALLTNNHGSVYAWFVVMISIFTIAILYAILTKPIIAIQHATNDTLSDPDYSSSYYKTITMWKYFPIVAIIGLIIVGLIYSIRKEPFSGYE